MPAMTRPSGKVAASGASASEPGPNSGASAGSDRILQTWSTISSRAALSASPADRSSQLTGRCRAAVARDRRQALEQLVDQVPRSAAARIASLGGGAAASSTAMADGASGRGGRASGGAGVRAQSGMVGLA